MQEKIGIEYLDQFNQWRRICSGIYNDSVSINVAMQNVKRTHDSRVRAVGEETNSIYDMLM